MTNQYQAPRIPSTRRPRAPAGRPPTPRLTTRPSRPVDVLCLNHCGGPSSTTRLPPHTRGHTRHPALPPRACARRPHPERTPPRAPPGRANSFPPIAPKLHLPRALAIAPRVRSNRPLTRSTTAPLIVRKWTSPYPAADRLRTPVWGDGGGYRECVVSNHRSRAIAPIIVGCALMLRPLINREN